MVGRPRGNRDERIASTAARLFSERGYHATSIDDIGRSEGITGGAIYRHFSSKDELLAAVIARGLSRLSDSLDQADTTYGSPLDHLARVVRAGGVAVVQDLDAMTVYVRDSRHLSPDRRRLVVEMARKTSDRFASAVSAARPSLSEAQIGFMLQSLAGMYLSLTYYRSSASRLSPVEVWTEMGTAAFCGAPSLGADLLSDQTELTLDEVSDTSRREAILREATALFARYGYGGVGIDAIGAAAGLPGPGVYRYFRSKDDLLSAALDRAADQTAAGAATALDAPNPAVGLERLIGTYVTTAIDNADTISVYFADVHSVSEPNRRAVHRNQRSYAAIWHGVLSELAPDRSTDEIRIAINAAVGFINGYAAGRLRLPYEAAERILIGITTSALGAFIDSPASTTSNDH